MCTNQCQFLRLFEICEIPVNQIGIISNNQYVSAAFIVWLPIFSTEKTLQNYNKYLSYANILLFYFAGIATLTHMLCTNLHS